MNVKAADARAALKALLDERLGERAGWLEASLAEATPESVGRMLLEAGRAVGRRPLIAGFAEREGATLTGTHGMMKIGHWRTDEAVRSLLLAHVADATEHPFRTLYALYDQGDTEARVAALRALNLVDDASPEQGLEMVFDAGRTYLEELMAAAWTHNPFATAHLNDTEYRKAVLKALFCDVPVDGFIGLEERADAELAKSLCEYADERVAAGRPVPHAVWIVAARHPRPGLVARLVGALEHPLPVERRVAATALANARDVRALPFVEERLAREEDPAVLDALSRAAENTRAALD
jgi:hypothetical protein